MEKTLMIFALFMVGALSSYGFVDAYAQQNENLYVSTMNNAFENYFTGAQIIEVIINDAQYRSEDFEGYPTVTVDDNPLIMTQGDNGNWYGYFVNDEMARIADGTTTVCGVGLDFGMIGTYGNMELAVNDGCNNVVRESTLRPAFIPVEFDDHFLESHNYPIIQLFDFAEGQDIIIEYGSGTVSQSALIRFDEVGPNAFLETDRMNYPKSGNVHITIQDSWFDIDPTSDDVWTFTTSPGYEALYYNVFESMNDNAYAVESAKLTQSDLYDLMCDESCVLTTSYDSALPVLTFQDTDDTSLTRIGDPNDPVSWGVIHNIMDEITEPTTVIEPGLLPITIKEMSPGIFSTTDKNFDSNVIISEFAQRGTSAVLTYNDKTTNVFVVYSLGTITMEIPDRVWGSGQEARIYIVDQDANLNSLDDEDLTIDDITNNVPTLITGNPFTIDENTSFGVRHLSLDDVPTGPLVTSWPEHFYLVSLRLNNNIDFNEINTLLTPIDEFRECNPTSSNAVTEKNQRINIVECSSVDPYSRIGVLNTGRTVPVYELHVNYNQPLSDLVSMFKDLDGFVFLSYNLESLNNKMDARGITYDGAAMDADLGRIDISLMAGECVVPLGNNMGDTDTILIDNTARMDMEACDQSQPVTLVFEFDSMNKELVENRTYMLYAPNTKAPITAEFTTFGIIDDGVQNRERVSNQIVRIEAEETSNNSGEFMGTLEYVMINQLNILDESTYRTSNAGENPTFVVMEYLRGADAPHVTYLDISSNGAQSPVSATQETPSYTGIVEFDANRYKVSDTVVVTLTDPDLNTDSDIQDTYTQVLRPVTSPYYGMIGTENARMLDIEFDENKFVSMPGCAAPGLDQTGFTLVETGSDTGVFVGSFQIPQNVCDSTGQEVGVSGLDITVNYLDFRDSSGETIESSDTSSIGANTGVITLDRKTYPVPFGQPEDFGFSTNDASVFPIHHTGTFRTTDTITDHFITEGDLIVYVRVVDNDFNISPNGVDSMATAVSGTENTGPVKISVIRGSNVVILGYAGGPSVSAGFINDGNVDAFGSDAVRQFGPLHETSGESGIFEIEIPIRYSDGPSHSNCPVTHQYSPLTGGRGDIPASERFGPRASGDYCILQGDILHVEYSDPTGSSGDPNTVATSATFDLRTGSMQTDNVEYRSGSDAILTIIDPDFDLDSRQAETIDLDLVEWDSDTATITMGDAGGQMEAFDPEPDALRETGDSTGIFQTIFEVPDRVGGKPLYAGEEITLEYVDWGPAGATFVGSEDEDVEVTFYTTEHGATIQLDKKVYTWTDKVHITIIAPDHNYDSDLVDTIGDKQENIIKINTRGHKLQPYTLVETGTNTGIFTGEIILSGFPSHDANGDGIGGDASGSTVGVGPTDGYLRSSNDDGLSVSFEYSEDNTVVSSALIRWNIGEIMWIDESHSTGGSGVIRVIDPDMNLNPEAADNFPINVWSDTDSGGIDLIITETGDDTGMFEGTVSFTSMVESSGHRLRVLEGDTVVAEYEDYTLPDPYSISDDLDISDITIIGTVIPPLERTLVEELRVVDQFGTTLTSLRVNQQAQITSNLINNNNNDNQGFVYLVQVQDSSGVVVDLTWIAGSMIANQKMSPAASWSPSIADTYTITVFVWESLNTPTALAPTTTMTVTVS